MGIEIYVILDWFLLLATLVVTICNFGRTSMVVVACFSDSFRNKKSDSCNCCNGCKKSCKKPSAVGSLWTTELLQTRSSFSPEATLIHWMISFVNTSFFSMIFCKVYAWMYWPSPLAQLDTILRVIPASTFPIFGEGALIKTTSCFSSFPFFSPASLPQVFIPLSLPNKLPAQ